LSIFDISVLYLLPRALPSSTLHHNLKLTISTTSGPIPLYLHTVPRPDTWMIRAGRTCKSRHLLTAIFIADVDSEALLFTILSQVPLKLDAPNVTEQYVGDVYRRLSHGEATIGAPMSMNWVTVLPDVLGFLLQRGAGLVERMVGLGAVSAKSSEIGAWGFRSEMWDKENKDEFGVVVYDVLTGAVSEI